MQLPTRAKITAILMHPDEIVISDEVVRALIDAQFPRWRDLSVRRLASTGTVNVIFRIGEDLAARFPLRLADANETRTTLRREARAAALLAKHSPIPTPRPVAIGEPGLGYLLPWSVQTWLTGTLASEADPGASTAFAADVADFIEALRAVDTGVNDSMVRTAGATFARTTSGSKCASATVSTSWTCRG